MEAAAEGVAATYSARQQRCCDEACPRPVAGCNRGLSRKTSNVDEGIRTDLQTWSEVVLGDLWLAPLRFLWALRIIRTCQFARVPQLLMVVRVRVNRPRSVARGHLPELAEEGVRLAGLRIVIGIHAMALA